jgi:hypothetical protein
LPDSLREKPKDLIEKTLQRELFACKADAFEHPDSFANSLEWSGDPESPNIARLTEEVILEGRASEVFPPPDRLQGWGFIKDKSLLVGSGLLIIVTVLVVGGLLFSK